MTEPTTSQEDEKLRNEIEGCLAVHMVQASDNGLRWAVDNIQQLIATATNRAELKALKWVRFQQAGHDHENTFGFDICPLCDRIEQLSKQEEE